MRTSETKDDSNGKGLHSILTKQEKHAIKVAIERYKQTGRLVNLKDITDQKLSRKK